MSIRSRARAQGAGSSPLPGPADVRPARSGVIRSAEWAVWLGAAFAARLAYGWLLHSRLAPGFGWEGDDGYDELARLWLGGHGYVRWQGGPPTLERLPLYPQLLGLLFRAGGGHAERLTWVVQSAFSTLSLAPLGALASRLGGARACRLALALGMIHPLGYLYNFRFMTEPLHLFLVSVFMWLSLRWVEAGGWLNAAGWGAALGAALMTRSALLPVAPILLAVTAIARSRGTAPAAGPRRWSGSLVLALLACLAVLAPWMGRAAALGGGLASSGAAAAVYHGLAVSRAAWERTDLGAVDRASDQELERRLGAALPHLRPADLSWEAERDKVARRLAAQSFAGGWLRAVESLRNLALSWYLTYTPRGTALAALFQIPLLVGLAAAVRRRGRAWPPAAWPALALAASVTLVQALVYPHFRFMAPATWAALALVAGGLAGATRPGATATDTAPESPGSGRGRPRQVA